MTRYYYCPKFKTYLVGYCENLRRKEAIIEAFSKDGARVKFRNHHPEAGDIIQIKEIEKEGKQ